MKPIRRAGAVLVSAALALLITSTLAQAQDRGRGGNAAEPPTLKAKVSAYEADISITLETKLRGGQVDKTEFSIVKEKTKIELGVGVKAIEPGMMASVWAEKDNPKNAARILVEPEAPTAKGKVTAYEADKSITVETSVRGGGTHTTEFSIVKDKTQIELGTGVKAIEVGMTVSVWAEKDNSKSAARIATQAAAPAGRNRPGSGTAPPDSAKPATRTGESTVAGTLQGVDGAKNTVTVTSSNRATGKVERTFEMAKDIVVLRDGKPAKVSDLKQAGHVSVKLSPDQKTAVSISETGRTMGGPLKSVDPANNTITLTLSGGGRDAVKRDVTYPLSEDGKVMLEDKEVKLEDLKDVRPGSTVQLTFSVDDEKKLVQIRYAPGNR